MTICFRSIALLALTAFSLPAQASTSDWTETPGGRVRVIVEDAAPGDGKQELRGALQIELKPGWKTYWRNPGDSGVPPQVSLEGEGAARIGFPAPVRFGGTDEGGIGYKMPVSLPLTFQVKPGDTRLKGNVFLGVCERICVPVQTEFDFPLGESAAASPQTIAARTIVETAFDRLPAPASPDFGVARASRDKDKALFELALPDADAPAELFVASDQLSLSDPVPVSGGATPRFSARMHGESKSAAVIDYTLVQNGKAVSGTVTLD